MRPNQVILVTGSSSGIGLAAAREAARRGHRVYASARRPESLQGVLSGPNIRVPRLDVTDPGAATEVVAQIVSAEGRLDALVNNAGYGQYGAIEDVSAGQWRAQFDVNVFGALESIRAALPPMRKAGWGTIVNVSSVAGRLPIPFAAPYCSTKHALEAISDALRVEVAPFGVRVVIVEPGPISTQFGKRARQDVEEILRRTGPYSPFYTGAERAMDTDFQRGALPPEAVATVIVDAIESGHPSIRYPVTGMARLLIPFRRFLPDRLLDAAFRWSLKLPRRA